MIILGSLIVLYILALAVATFYNGSADNKPEAKVFADGTKPSPAPNGFLQGNSFTGMGASWQGKVFDAAGQTGINRFEDSDHYTFTTYEAKGLRNPDQTVLRIDYSQAGNPLWLRFVVDEIVQTSPDHYRGKVNIKTLPGLTFTLTYFQLEKP